MLPYVREHKIRARELRKNMTEAERLLWAKLRRKQILGVPFYRQKPIGPYVADFYCSTVRLVIELDGAQHQSPDHGERDQLRDQDLRSLGLSVLRFPNRRILSDLAAVVTEIEEFVSQSLRKTTLSRSRRPTQYARPKRKRATRIPRKV